MVEFRNKLMWTRVIDELPKSSGWYFVALKNKTVKPVYMVFNRNLSPNWGGLKNSEVTHWIPFPPHPDLPRKELNHEVGDIRWI